MIPNGVKKAWAAGKPVLNGWLSTSSPFVAEIMAAAGYDSLTIDLQHGLVGYEAATAMLQAMRASGVAPIVRAPWLDPSDIMKALDAGAVGVICPMIDNAAQAAQLVSAMRYPPDGLRSFGPTRANIAYGGDYGDRANEAVVCLAMIETAEGFANVDAICATPGLDGLYVGPSDLTLGLTGRKYPTGLDREEPDMIEAIKHVLAAAHKAGIKAGIHCGSAEYAGKALGWGFDLVTVSNDVRLLAAAAQKTIAEARKFMGQSVAAPAPAKSMY